MRAAFITPVCEQAAISVFGIESTERHQVLPSALEPPVI
jgi:hypothetical protein